MHFQYPSVLLLLWILPFVVGLLVYAQRKRMAAASRFVDEPMVARLMPRLRGSRPWLKGTLLVLGLSLLIVAAARPRFGVYFEKVVQRGVDCFVLLDVSRSMLAEDVPPNRLERAKSDIRDLLKKLAGDHVGLIVFAGKPVLRAPLTTDDGFFRMILDDVDTHSAPRGGTLIGDAIRKAIEAMPPRADHDQVLVLITDGEDQESYPEEAAKQAAERGIKIFTVGLGDSAEGARIPVRNQSGELEYLKNEGKIHWSKSDQDVLKRIALATGGVHISAGTRAYDLGQIYEDHLASLTRGEDVQNLKRKRYRERYQIFLALGIVLLTAEMLVPGCARRTTASEAPDAGPVERTQKRRATLPTVILVALMIFPSSVFASEGKAASKVGEGIDAFRAGNFKAASEAFAEADQSLPNEPKIAFDRGCAYAAGGENDNAIEQFRTAAMSPDHKLAAMAHYNLGCLAIAKAKTQFGKSPEEAAPEVRREGLETLEHAALHFRDGLGVDPEHADARYNLESVRLWVKHIQKVWKQRDRQQRREKMNLLEFLKALEQEQRELRATDRTLVEVPRSPLHREKIRAVEDAQRDLVEEIRPLKEKIQAALAGPAQKPSEKPAGPPPGNSADAARAGELLNRLSDEVGDTMSDAADLLAARNVAEAVKRQAVAVEKLDHVFMAVAPFTNIVQKAIAAQEGLIGQSKQAVSPAKDMKDSTKQKEGEAESDKRKEAEEKPEEIDWDEAAWNQRFISGYGRILPAKAKQELERLEKTPVSTPAMPAASPDASGAPATSGDATATAEQRKKQREEMKRALQAGVDLAPKVEELASEATASLEADKPKDALPSQEEALKLLKEMLPKQDQKKNDQKNQDQKKKDQKKDDQKKKNQDKKDQDKKDQDKQNQKKKDQQKQDQRKQQKKEDLSRQEAEIMMRKARERREERRELEKALQEYLYRPDRVDRDW